MSLASLSIKRPIFITSLVALMLIVGIFSLKKMPVDLFPDATFPIIFIQTPYPGASPLDVEKLVSKPIEDELGTLSGLKSLTSNNLESFSFVILEFKLGTDVKDAEQQIRNRIGNIKKNLPADILEPVIRRFDPADQPIVSLSVNSSLDEAKLYDLVSEVIKPQIDKIPNVGQVNIIGGRKQEIQVLVDKEKMQERNLSVLQIAKRITDTSKDVPIGKYDGANSETVFRAVGEFQNLDELQKVSVNFLGSDRAIQISEVANVQRGLEDVKRIARVNGQKALILDIFKQSGANTVAVADSILKIKDQINDYLKTKNVDAKIELVRDLSRPIKANIQDVSESIILGIVLTIIVVLFFLGSFRSTFITGMALPNSLLGGFILMAVMGFTINLMTLLALSLAVGLLIDDAIVVRENIFRHMEMGKKPIDAAIEGTKEVSMAVLATTLVVIAVFGPVAFLQGTVGQFFKQFGLTIVFAMLISLFDAFTVAPMLSAYLASHNEHEKGKGIWGRILQKFDDLQNSLEDMYEATLRYTVKNKKKVLFVTFVVFFLSLFSTKYIAKTFLPANDFGEFGITVETKPGTSIEGTSDFVKNIEQVLSQEKAIEYFATTVGSQSEEANKATIFIRLVPRAKRTVNTSEMKEVLRSRLSELGKQAVIEVTDIDISGGGQKPFNLNLKGDNLEVLAKYADDLKVRLKKIPDLVDVDTNFRSGKPEYHVIFDRNKSEKLGVSTVTAGAELRARTEGIEAAEFRENGIEYKIKVKLDEKYRDLRSQINDSYIPNQNFNMIPISKIATGKESLGYSQINRRDKNRFINISANLSKKGSLGAATEEVEKILQKELPLPPGVDYRFQGQAEDFKDLMTNMLLAMLLGIIFIYLVLSSLYESFITPFTILLALPFAITGAMLALFITGKSIDIFSMIGIIMLLGVVAKNSILLVDYSKQLIDQGMDQEQALIKASRTRLRPILMTSLALIAGTLPIAIGLTELSTQRASMGMAIIGGVLSSTLLTLIVVPAAFGYIDNFRLKSAKMIRELWH